MQRAQAIEDTAARQQNGFSRDVSTAAGYRRGGTKGDQRAETLGSYLPDAVLSYGGALCVGEGDGGIQQDVVGDGGVFGIRQFDALDMGAGLLLEGVRGSLFEGRLERTAVLHQAADVVYVMVSRRMLASGTPNEVLGRSDVRAALSGQAR